MTYPADSFRKKIRSFLTTSMSAVSATYLRFSGLEVDSALFDREEIAGREADPRNCGGVPGGVVDTAVHRYESAVRHDRIVNTGTARMKGAIGFTCTTPGAGVTSEAQQGCIQSSGVRTQSRGETGRHLGNGRHGGPPRGFS